MSKHYDPLRTSINMEGSSASYDMLDNGGATAWDDVLPAVWSVYPNPIYENMSTWYGSGFSAVSSDQLGYNEVTGEEERTPIAL